MEKRYPEAHVALASVYRDRKDDSKALDELRRAAGTQFCPRCVAALERILPIEGIDDEDTRPRVLVAS
jgi:HD-GYP domain-containing protein (c-di-GMP phosphodiesterase class II)